MRIGRSSEPVPAGRDAKQRTRGEPARRQPDRGRGGGAPVRRRPAETPARDSRSKNSRVSGPAREQRPLRHGPATTPMPRSTRPKNADQARARAKARKAKAPKVVRPPLRQRLLTRLASIDVNPRSLLARVPFVVLVIGALGLGLGVTLWLSTDAAERSYQLGHARQLNQALQQQKEALERQVLEAQAAPALAESARELGMIPSRDTAHLVKDPAGNWIVVGTPKPAEGAPPAPLNVTLPDDPPPPAPRPAPPAPVRLPERPAGPTDVRAPVAPGQPLPATAPGTGPEVPVRTTAGVPVPLDHGPAPGPVAEGAGPAPGPAPGPSMTPLTGPAPGPAPGPAVAAPVPVLPVTPAAPGAPA